MLKHWEYDVVKNIWKNSEKKSENTVKINELIKLKIIMTVKIYFLVFLMETDMLLMNSLALHSKFYVKKVFHKNQQTLIIKSNYMKE